MIVHGTTKVFAILGDPVAHSLSPKMHNAALTALGIDGEEAFVLWTGTAPPVGVMKTALSF